MVDQRVDNFGGGPAVLPLPVLQQVQEEMLNYHGSGMSVLEISHRSKWYKGIQDDTDAVLRRLFNVPDDYQVLFLQGGASLQFAMLPMNFMGPGQTAGYVLSGSWSEKSYQEARNVGEVRVAASSKEAGYKSIPQSWTTEETDAYVHVTSNNTIFGTQWAAFPEVTGTPVVADMSSDILSRPVEVSKFHMIYAGAQKNLGPAGVTLVIVRKDWVEHAEVESLPKMLRYATHIKANSTYNTPPVFPVYVMGQVLHWIEAEGGLNAVADRNTAKAQMLYQVIDDSNGFYMGYADANSRSHMNVTFNLQSVELEQEFLNQAQENGFVGLNGHRSVGGCRASIYNALPQEACERLAQFMRDFQVKHA